MTREESIIEMQRMKKACCDTHTDAQLKKDSKIIDALDLGIKALEQNLCEYTIGSQEHNAKSKEILNALKKLDERIRRIEDKINDYDFQEIKRKADEYTAEHKGLMFRV